MVFQNNVHSARSQRLKKPPWAASGCASGTTAGCVAASFTHFCTSVATINTVARPATRRTSANCQPSTKPINTNVAGLSSGLPIQNASAPPIDTCCLRIPAATGAAQQVHIMPGSEKIAPSSVP